MIKRILCLICLLLSLAFLPLSSAAHSGRTDSKGGHYDRETGDYHYHHGYPAHDHPGGVCPYEDAPPSDSDSNNPGIVILLLLAAGGVGVFVIYKLKNR